MSGPAEERQTTYLWPPASAHALSVGWDKARASLAHAHRVGDLIAPGSTWAGSDDGQQLYMMWALARGLQRLGPPYLEPEAALEVCDCSPPCPRQKIRSMIEDGDPDLWYLREDVPFYSPRHRAAVYVWLGGMLAARAQHDSPTNPRLWLLSMNLEWQYLPVTGW